MTAVTLTPDAVLPRRVNPLAAVRHTLTLTWRNLVQIKHNPFELLDLSVQPIMFVLLFAYVFGGAIGGSVDKYLQFALPGIIVQTMMFATLSTAIGLNTDITKGVFDRFRSLPIARSSPLFGRVVADTLKQVWSFGLMLGVGMILGFRIKTDVFSVLLALALLLVFALAMSWISVFIGMVAKSPENVQVFAFTLMMPLTFVSNAFVGTSTMPTWLQKWVEINPVSLLADAVRGLTIGGYPVPENAGKAMLWAAGIVIVFAPLALRAYKRRI